MIEPIIVKLLLCLGPIRRWWTKAKLNSDAGTWSGTISYGTHRIDDKPHYFAYLNLKDVPTDIKVKSALLVKNGTEYGYDLINRLKRVSDYKYAIDISDIDYELSWGGGTININFHLDRNVNGIHQIGIVPGSVCDQRPKCSSI